MVFNYCCIGVKLPGARGAIEGNEKESVLYHPLYQRATETEPHFSLQLAQHWPQSQSKLEKRNENLVPAHSSHTLGSLLPRPLVPPPRLPEPLVLDIPDSGFAFFHSLEVPELKDNGTTHEACPHVSEKKIRMSIIPPLVPML